MVEAILTCNWILGLEFLGMSEKKRGFVTFGIGYRIYCVVANIILLIAVFAGFFEWYWRNITYGDPSAEEYIKIFALSMKIVLGIIVGFSIVYNVSFKIRYQIKVRNLMKEEENGIPISQTYPQTYYPQGNPQMYPQGNPQMYPQSYPQKYPQNY